MTGVVEGEGHSRPQLVGLVIIDPLKILQRLGGIFLGVNRLNRGLPQLLALFVDVGHVHFLDMAAVQEHGIAEVGGGRGAQDPPPKALAHQVGDIAGVVDVGVGQHQDIDGRRVVRKIPVDSPGLFPLPLKETAFQQNLLPVQLQQVLGAGDGLDCPVKGDVHGVSPL